MPQGKYTLDDLAPAPKKGKYSADDIAEVVPAPKASPGGVSRFASSAADSSGLSMLGHALAHPLDTANTVLDAGAESLGLQKDDGTNPILNNLKSATDATVQNAKKAWQDYHREGLTQKTRRDIGRAVPVVGPTLARAQAEHDAGNDAGMAGTLTGAVAGLVAPSAIKELAPKVGGALQAKAAELPAAADQSATGIINKTVGARAADFKRGVNPGRGYVKAGLGVKGSMESIADASAEAKEAVAQKLADAYANATASGKRIPVGTVRRAVHGVIDDAKNSAQGPGVVADPEAYENLRKTFEKDFADAAQQGGYTPQQLWDIRKNINRNLNWGDQSKLNLTQTQQRVSGAISGILKDAVPETVDLNQQFQDLTALADRAESRALTHSEPLSGMAAKAALSGAGALAGHGTPLGTAGGAAIGSALKSVPLSTARAAFISKAGRAAAPLIDGVAKRASAAAPIAAVPAALATVSGGDLPDGVGDANEDDGHQGTVEKVDHDETPASNATPAPDPAKISSVDPTPDTHLFDRKLWLQGNPGGDDVAAAEEARKQGFEVVEG